MGSGDKVGGMRLVRQFKRHLKCGLVGFWGLIPVVFIPCITKCAMLV